MKQHHLSTKFLMFYVFIGLIGNLIIDIAYGIADPRVRVNK